jgi:NMD protein affecting ribosome stability and mRNA decay
MTGTKGGFSGEQRSDRLIHEHVHDPYRMRKKIQEPAFCPQCEAVYDKGRWVWGDRPSGAETATCPACSRIEERQHAGIIHLNGDFLSKHKDEIIGLARNEEEKEKGEHPLHRIMEIEDGKEGTVITTTDIHLPRRIGAAIKSAYDGELDFHYEEETYFIRVNWTR